MSLKRTLLIVIPLLVLGLVIYYMSDIVTYLIISWILSLIGAPIVDRLEGFKIGQNRLSRSISAIFTLIILIIGFSLILVLFAPLVIELANTLSQISYENIFSTIQEPLDKLTLKLQKWGIVSDEEVTYTAFYDVIKNYFKPAALGNFVTSIIGTASSLLIGIFSVLFITFFFLKESTLFNQIITTFVPSGYEKQTETVISRITAMLRSYFTGILLQMTIITIIISVGLSILNVPNALLIGLFAALINLVPYVGPMIGALFAIFLTISANIDAHYSEVVMPQIIKVAIVFGIMQMIDNFILQPFIYSKSVKAHPLEIFIVILIAAKIGGILGMIVAIPAYTVMRVIASEFLTHFKIVQRITQNMNNPDPVQKEILPKQSTDESAS